MLSEIQFQSLRFYAGCLAPLNEPTALVTLTWVGEVPAWERIAPKLAAGMAALQLDVMKPLAAESASFGESVHLLTTALQRSAYDPVGRGYLLEQNGQAMCLALPWVRPEVLKDALALAMHLLFYWMQADTPLRLPAPLQKQLDEWLQGAQQGGMSPNSMRFVDAARERQLPVAIRNGILQIGWGACAERLDSSFTGHTSVLATKLARNKFLTRQHLNRGALPVAPGALVASREDALEIALKLNWPVVIKPANQDQGAGVTPGILDAEQLCHAFDRAARLSPGGVLLEKHIEGDDYRMLVVGGHLIATTKRTPGGIVGDGVSTVTELVERLNADPLRGTGKRSMLIRLSLDDEARVCLAVQGLTVNSVPAGGAWVPLRRTANISTGGTATDVTHEVHPDNRLLAERAARLIGLDIAGVDFLCPDIRRSWHEVGGAICEVNAQPGFRVHWLGDPARDINGEVLDWIFRDKPGRVPTAAITGTNGKTTTARMLHHIWLAAGKHAGVCTTQGVWIGRELVADKNLSGQPGGQLLLDDPTVEAAVIEMPRKGLIMFGHPCDSYDVAALLNVQDDHIGQHGIDSLEDMAQLKASVLARATKAVVVNADDPLCMEMMKHSKAAHHVLVARDPDCPGLRQHVACGGDAVYAVHHDGKSWLSINSGKLQTLLMPFDAIPATANGLLPHNEGNALFAVAMAWALGIEPEIICGALGSFANSPEHNPGRYNFIGGFPFQIMLDFAHNPQGVAAVCEIVREVPVTGRRVLVSLCGNRCRQHVMQNAPLLAEHFDHIIVSQSDDSFRASQLDFGEQDPLGEMLAFFEKQIASAAPEKPVVVQALRDPDESCRVAFDSAEAGDFVVVLAEPWVVLRKLEQMQRFPAVVGKG